MSKKNNNVNCTNCITGTTEEFVFSDKMLVEIIEQKSSMPGIFYVGPGLVDLQVNGINGIDFNNAELTAAGVADATNYLLSQGVTSYFPTVITNSYDNISRILATISEACASFELVNECVAGIHLEGPFLSSVPGARGAHNEAHLRLPDWDMFSHFQKIAGGRIKLITIAPELEGAETFIKKCVDQNVMVSIGHSIADREQIHMAVKAGASMATHLGNAVPLMMPRHPNILWDLLATDELTACVIADGLHVPDAFLKVVMKTKGDATVVVSDATCFAGMAPGEYENAIGGTVILDAEKRVSLKSTPGLLAGAAKTLLENIETLISHHLCTPGEAWKMASVNAVKLVLRNGLALINEKDFVVFSLHGKTIQIEKVIKNGRMVFEA